MYVNADNDPSEEGIDPVIPLASRFIYINFVKDPNDDVVGIVPVSVTLRTMMESTLPSIPLQATPYQGVAPQTANEGTPDVHIQDIAVVDEDNAAAMLHIMLS
eukprot:gene13201-27920_t